MAKTKGAKNISEKAKEEIKAIVRPRLKFRDTHKELIMKLEDEGYDISIASLNGILKEIREGLSDRFKEIGEYELAQEHDFAIEMMKDLMVKLRLQWSDPEVDKMRLSAEIRAIQRDLIDYYGSTEIVENVFKYFNVEDEEKKEEKVKEIKKTIISKKKPTKKRELMTVL